MKLSVLLPTYNAGPHLRKALDSICCQTFADFELLILDDASVDGTDDEIRKAVATDSRIRAVFHKTNSGLAATLNEGIALARGIYIARMDQDDIALPDRLRLQVDYLDRHPNVAVVGSRALYMAREETEDCLVELPLDAETIRRRLRQENCVFHPTVTYRRDAIAALGGYRAEFRNAEDYDLWLRVSRQHDIVNLPLPLLRYRLSPDGMTYGRRWEQLSYVLLAQESDANPGASLESLQSRVDARLATIDRQHFFNTVAEAEIRDLKRTGWPEEAATALARVSPELSPATRRRLSAEISGTPGPQCASEAAAAATFGVKPGTRAFAMLGRVFLPCLVILPQLVWIFRDQRPWPWDPAWYGEVATDLWWLLRNDLTGWAAAMLAAFEIKAPGIAWFAQFFVPVGQALGSVERGLLLSILVTTAASYALLLSLGRLLAGGQTWGAWFAVLAVSSAPLTVGLSRQFFAESLQMLSITYALWVAIRAPTMPTRRVLSHGAIATLAGLLAKVSTPAYLLAPLAYTLRGLVRRRGRETRPAFSLHDWLLFATVVLLSAGAAAWYLRNGAATVSFAFSAAGGATSLAYGHERGLMGKFAFWLTSAFHATLLPATALILGGCLGIAIFRCLRNWYRPHGSFALLALLSGVGVTGLLIVFSTQVNEDTRYLLPLVPLATVPLVWVLRRAESRPLIAAALLALAAQAVVVHGRAHRLFPASPRGSVWLSTVSTDTTQRSELIRLAEATSPPANTSRHSINVVELPWLNANTLSFFAAQHRLAHGGARDYYTPMGYAVTDVERAWQRLDELRARYVISLAPEAQPQPPNFLNRTAREVHDRLAQTVRYRRLPFPSTTGVELYERIE